MEDSELSKSEDHKRKVESSYDETASNYDSVASKRMITSSNKLLRDLEILENPVVLDVGCGTGIATFILMDLYEKQGTFHGIDISQEMVEQASESAVKKGYTNVSFKKGDAERLDFPDDMFDLVISNLVLHWVPDKKKAFSEIFRVLKPGGQIALTFNGDLHLIETLNITAKIELEHPELMGGSKPAAEHTSFQISLEDTHFLFEDIGFVDVSLYEERRLVFTKRDSKPLDRQHDVTAAWWAVGLSPETIGKVMGLAMKEMALRSTSKGFKGTRHVIFAYGKKPV